MSSNSWNILSESESDTAHNARLIYSLCATLRKMTDEFASMTELTDMVFDMLKEFGEIELLQKLETMDRSCGKPFTYFSVKLSVSKQESNIMLMFPLFCLTNDTRRLFDQLNIKDEVTETCMFDRLLDTKDYYRCAYVRAFVKAWPLLQASNSVVIWSPAQGCGMKIGL